MFDQHDEGGAHALQAGSTEPSADQLQELIVSTLDADKAEDIVAIDLMGKSSVADVMIIASGRSQRHVGALADHVVRQIKKSGRGTVAIEGQTSCDWVLVDAGDVILHLFRPEVRGFYNLEKMWSVDPDSGDSA